MSGQRLFSVDVESDGPCPGLYSMVSFAAVRIQAGPLDCHFFAEVAPLSAQYVPEALAVSGVSREQHLAYADPRGEMLRFAQWIQASAQGCRPVLVSDNPAFDWQFINYYLHAFTGGNPFGHSARRIGDFAAGLEKSFSAGSKWKKLRKTAHTHHPLDDAKGNAEALIALAAQHQVKLPGVA